jgi:hypothetical protein
MSVPLRFLMILIAAGQSLQIGIVDFYGLRRTPPDSARAALTFKEGDAVSLAGDERPAFLSESEARLAKVPGVDRAQIHLVCCENGRAIVYVGVEERGSAAMAFRTAPKGDARLAADIVQAEEEFSKALMAAVQRGDADEDRSQGHSLVSDPATRAVQERFILYARRDLSQLRRVLRSSSFAAERALAAQVLGYVADKASVIDDLAYAMGDPSEEVRNNATRALMVIAEMTPVAGRSVPRIPPQPFIALLHSPIWTDRNKSSLALMTLTSSREPRLLAALRQPETVTALAEMARWKSEGHAQAAFLILARLAGYSDDDALNRWQRGEREVVIEAALARK